jgi:hypothetical protein
MAENRYWPLPPLGCAGADEGAGCGAAGAGAGDGVAGAGADGCGIADGFAGVGDGVGAPGNVVNGAGPVGASGLVVRDAFATSARAIEVLIKIVARTTVVRVNAFAVPRPVIRPPIPPPPLPSPSPPPSDRCNRMTPIIAMQTTIWMVNRTGNKAAMATSSRFRAAVL